MRSLAGAGMPFAGFVAYNVDVHWYRGSQPSAMVAQPLVYGSAAQSANNLYGDGSHAGGDTDSAVGSAAALFAQQGMVPVPDVAEDGAPSDAFPRYVGNGSPIGVITPSQAGAQYTDLQSGHIWIANGLTNSSWTLKR